MCRGRSTETGEGSGEDAGERSIVDVLMQLDEAVAAVVSVDLDGLPARTQLDALAALEAARRRLDHGTDRLAGHVDRSGAFGIDGHRSAKAALKAVARIDGPEAHARIRTARVLREMPEVATGYGRGDIPTASVRAIARTMANPRVSGFAGLVDSIFAEQAAQETVEAFQAWLRDWERIADTDGAEREAAQTHERRHASLVENRIDGSWSLRAGHGALEGAVMADILAVFEDAEFTADWEAAKAVHGADTRVEHLARTPTQRRADALFAIFRRAASMPSGARAPEPLVNIVIDRETFERELLRGAGADVPATDVTDVARRRCQTVGGTRIAPSEAVAAALVGHVRRVVVDGASSVIDLGRRRRLFTGSARDAAVLQAVLAHRDGLRCARPGCEAPVRRLQADHRCSWATGGRTDVANSQLVCGPHNVLKEHERVASADPVSTWRTERPE